MGRLERQGGETTADTRVTARVNARLLPASPPVASRALFGSGQLCEVCDERIVSSAIEITCELPHRPTVRLHVPCYRAWIAYARVHTQPPEAPAAGSRTVYLLASAADLALLETYLGASATRLPFNVATVRCALRDCSGSDAGSEAPMSLPLPATLGEALKAWLDKDARRLAEAGYDSVSRMLRRIEVALSRSVN